MTFSYTYKKEAVSSAPLDTWYEEDMCYNKLQKQFAYVTMLGTFHIARGSSCYKENFMLTLDLLIMKKIRFIWLCEMKL